ncbi:uncharacterized protein LOC128092492 isoform X5 [Culex pipiens pallens]|uniref:uncharacterized protein LOC128092492 isoform X5 n=1 Tax=Culex pipiens pallens TaxID=42434 RepID=UPI0022AA85B0|nr:uncharacterized protein LOC128092492 isoform X5 [Culex pipiens pallens]
MINIDSKPLKVTWRMLGMKCFKGTLYPKRPSIAFTSFTTQNLVKLNWPKFMASTHLRFKTGLKSTTKQRFQPWFQLKFRKPISFTTVNRILHAEGYSWKVLKRRAGQLRTQDVTDQILL